MPETPDQMSADEGRRAALLAELGIALIEAGCVEELLQRLADAAREVSGAEYAAIGVLDQAGTSLAQFITSGIDEETRARIGDLPVGRGLLGAIIREKTAIRIADISEDPRSVGFPEGHPPMTSFLGLPIRLRDRIYGNIYVTDPPAGGSFSEADEQLVETLAAYAAIAIRGGELRDERDRWIDGLEGICSISGAIGRSFELSELLPEAARRTRGLLDCDTVGIALLENDRLHFPFAHGPNALGLEALRTEEAGLSDLEARVEQQLPSYHCLVEELTADDRQIGALVVVSKARLDQWHQRVTEVLASHIASSLATAEDFQEQRRSLLEEADDRLRKSEEWLRREAQERALLAQEDERARVARELHDETSQLLSGLGMRLKALGSRADPTIAEEAERLRAHVKDVQDSVRQILRQLRPVDLELGLGQAITEAAERVNETTSCEVTVEVSPLPPINTEVELVLYRISQEALTNVARHSQASRASVILTSFDDRLRLTVEDDGVGFDPHADTDRFGLAGIAERIALVGGELRVTSSPGAGTAVTVDVAATRPQAQVQESSD